MKWLRRILFSVFVLLYLMVCPVVVGYALGYLFNPGASQGIVKTGLIHLASAPSGAVVTVDGRRFSEPTPTIIRNLLPGEYKIRVVLKGHKPWERAVSVEAGKAAAFEHILLLPGRWQPARILEKQFFESLVPFGEQKLLLVELGARMTRGRFQLGEFWLFDRGREEGRPLIPGDSLFAPAQVLQSYVKPSGRCFLLHVRLNGTEKVLWIKPESEGIQIEELPAVLSQKPEAVDWDPAQDRFIFVQVDGDLYRWDRLDPSAYPVVAHRIRGFGFRRGSLYILHEDGRFERRDRQGELGEWLLKDAELAASIFGKSGRFQVHPFSDQTFLFLGGNGELVSNHLPYHLIERGVKGFAADPIQDRIAVWTKTGVGILDFSAKKRDLGVFQEGPLFTWLFDQGSDIQQVFWVFQSSHLLVHDRDRLLLVSLESPEEPLPMEGLRVQRGSAVFYSEQDRRLYYLDASAGDLVAVQVVSRKGFLEEGK